MNPWDSALNISADRSSTVMSLNQVSVTVCHHYSSMTLRAASRWWIGQRWLILAIVAVGQVFIIFQRHNLEEKSKTNLIWTNGVCHTWHWGCRGNVLFRVTRRDGFLSGFTPLFQCPQECHKVLVQLDYGVNVVQVHLVKWYSPPRNSCSKCCLFTVYTIYDLRM